MSFFLILLHLLSDCLKDVCMVVAHTLDITESIVCFIKFPLVFGLFGDFLKEVYISFVILGQFNRTRIVLYLALKECYLLTHCSKLSLLLLVDCLALLVLFIYLSNLLISI